MLIAVGGHSRNVGKTSLVCGIIAAMPDLRWQAVKITQHGHNVCANDGHACNCAPENPDHPYAIDRQIDPDATDTGRYLQAGATSSWWIRTAQGELGHAIGEVKKLFAQSENNIVESNSLLQFVKPDLYVVALDYTILDMKDSARLYLDRADAFVLSTHGLETPPWPGIPERWIRRRPSFLLTPGDPIPQELASLVRLTVH